MASVKNYSWSNAYDDGADRYSNCVNSTSHILALAVYKKAAVVGAVGGGTTVTSTVMTVGVTTGAACCYDDEECIDRDTAMSNLSENNSEDDDLCHKFPDFITEAVYLIILPWFLGF